MAQVVSLLCPCIYSSGILWTSGKDLVGQKVNVPEKIGSLGHELMFIQLDGESFGMLILGESRKSEVKTSRFGLRKGPTSSVQRLCAQPGQGLGRKDISSTWSRHQGCH